MCIPHFIYLFIHQQIFWVVSTFWPLWIMLIELVLLAQSCPTLCNPMDCSPPGSSVYGILQARILEWVAISFSRGSSPPIDRTLVSHLVGGFFTIWDTREALLIDYCYGNICLSSFNSFQYLARSEIGGSWGNSTFNFWRNGHTVE